MTKKHLHTSHSITKHYACLFIVLLVWSFSFSACHNREQASNPENQNDNNKIHPNFSLTLPELNSIIQDLPECAQNSIINRPQYFLELIDRALDLPDIFLILVDKEHSLPADYTPPDLVHLKEYALSISRNDLTVSRKIMPALLAMTEAARLENVELVYSSTYRSYEYQDYLYNRYVEKHGQTAADRFSASPGHSQHQLGTALDFGSITREFIDTDQGQWLKRNAWRFGFSLSYPQNKEELTGYMYEPWHYRYITRTGTQLEQDFFCGIQQYFLHFFHYNKEKLGKTRY